MRICFNMATKHQPESMYNLILKYQQGDDSFGRVI